MSDIEINSSIKDYFVNFCDHKKVIEKYRDEEVIFVIDDYLYDSRKDFFDEVNFVKLSASEWQKSYDGAKELIEKLLNFGVTRRTKLVAMGGGVTQDVTSFVSSILFRGIEWVFIPTTLLSQGDSCIGSKTSINFAGYKNTLGNFYPPSAVYIDVTFLDTLSEEQKMSGFGELLHYVMIAGDDSLPLFEKCFSGDTPILRLISRCLTIKQRFIECDEFDTGERIILNYGHSFGHAIEGALNNKISHGVAVAYGMDCANYISYTQGFMSEDDYKKYNKIMSKIYKTFCIENLSIDDMITCLKKDKKNTKTDYRFILCEKAGHMFVKNMTKDDTVKNLITEWKELIKHGLD